MSTDAGTTTVKISRMVLIIAVLNLGCGSNPGSEGSPSQAPVETNPELLSPEPTTTPIPESTTGQDEPDSASPEPPTPRHRYTPEDICDGADSDDDQYVDEGFDRDKDGYWDEEECASVRGYKPWDCDDSDPTTFPKFAELSCDNIDDDCDDLVDEDWDQDGDQQALCPPGSPATGLDCDDSDSDIKSGTQETMCDGIDDNCNNVVDEGFDYDGDGYVNAGCEVQGGVAPGMGDCDDFDQEIFPGATETCDTQDNDCDSLVDEQMSAVEIAEKCDHLDNDCDGQVDEVPDTDGDNQPDGTGESEICDQVDNDCDGRVDEGFDPDGDGFFPVDTGCEVYYGMNQLDCDESDPLIHTDAHEVCDELDNDCDGRTDEDYDQDHDGAFSSVLCIQSGRSSGTLDCDDNDATRRPGADEICDGIDHDCDGRIATASWEDNDGWSACEGDCSPRNPEIAPSLAEVEGDGLDNNCDGYSDAELIVAPVGVIPEPGKPTFVSVQEAIDAARSGDRILVMPGTYMGFVNYSGKDVVVQGQAGPDTTILQAPSSGRVVELVNGEGPGAVLAWLTVQGGVASTLGDSDGGGILVRGSSPTLRGLIVRDNISRACISDDSEYPQVRVVTCDEGRGGGVAVLGGSDITLDRVSFLANRALVGGGLLLEDSTALIRGCNFRGNEGYLATYTYNVETAESREFAGWGGGIALSPGASATIQDCTFEVNISLHGGAIWHTGTSLMLTNALFDHNRADVALSDRTSMEESETTYHGEGGSVNLNGPATLENTLFCGSRAHVGGAIYTSNSTITLHRMHSTRSVSNLLSREMYDYGSSGTVRWIRDFSGTGAALFAVGGDLTAEQLQLEGDQGGQGGAISLEDTHIYLRYLFVTGASANSLSQDYSLYDPWSATGYVLESYIASEAGNGGALHALGGSIDISHFVISNSHAREQGGAIYLDPSRVISLRLASGLILGAGAPVGGGIYCDLAPDSQFNVTGTMIGGTLQSSAIFANNLPMATINYSNLFDNLHGNVVFDQGQDPLGTTNIHVDPAFVSYHNDIPAKSWDLRLQAESPCRDAGPEQGETDPDLSRQDIGAYGGPGADGWELDGDGFPQPWTVGQQEGSFDCDDFNPDTYPGTTCPQ